MKYTNRYSIALLLLLAVADTFAGGPLAGSFVQLHRRQVAKTTADWQREFQLLHALGGRTVIVQWAAECPVLYFQPAGDLPMDAPEIFPVLERIIAAAERESMDLYLGLLHQPEYWVQIHARDQVLREFLLIRMARNARLHAALLETFGDSRAWVGTYIPDEIDDYSWRALDRRPHIQEYIRRMAGIIRRNDPGRAIAVSGFFRGRTSPVLVANIFRDITIGSELDYFLIQDGVGTGDPPLRYASIYYDMLRRTWDAVAPTQRLPELWGVVEAFTQTSAAHEPFEAVPAPADRFSLQMQAAHAYFPRLILFTLSDYMDPRLGVAAEAIYDAAREFVSHEQGPCD